MTATLQRPPVQRQMDLRDPRYRPMAGVNAAMRDLDLTAVEVTALLDGGDLIGWNIATGEARREIRVLTDSLAHYQRTLGSRPYPFEEGKVLRLILPHDKPALSGVEIQRAFNCDSGHVINLIEAKLLKIVPGTDWQRGPGGSPSVTRTSVIEFLKRRLA